MVKVAVVVELWVSVTVNVKTSVTVSPTSNALAVDWLATYE